MLLAPGATNSVSRDEFDNPFALEGAPPEYAKNVPGTHFLTLAEAKTAFCGGCHGPLGVSSDAATPSLAGQ